MVGDTHPTAREFLACELILTTSCNIHCTYCIAHSMGNSRMDSETWQAAVDMFVDLSRGAKLLEITFTGGGALTYV